MQCPGALQLALQRLDQRLRAAPLPILAALAIAHGDLVAGEVHVLYPQRAGIPSGACRCRTAGSPAATCVRPAAASSRCTSSRRQHRRHAPRPLRPRPRLSIHGRSIPEHFPVEEQQRRQRLVLRAGGHLPLHRQRGQEALHLRRPHLTRVPTIIGQDVAPDPTDISPFGPQAVALCAQPFANLIQQSRFGTVDRDPSVPGE